MDPERRHQPEWQPVLNPLANLVYSARGGADTVLCNGRILLEDGIVLSIDENRALAEAKQRGERIATEFRTVGLDQTEVAGILNLLLARSSE